MNEGYCDQLGQLDQCRATVVAEPTSRAARWQIVIAVFPGFPSVDASVMAHVFRCANEVSGDGALRYSVRFMSANGGLITGSAHMSVWSDSTIATSMDVVFVLGGDEASAAMRDARTVDWLREMRQRTPLLIGVEKGRALVAAAGGGPTDPSGTHDEAAWMLCEHAPSLAAGGAPSDTYASSDALASALLIVKRDLGLERALEVGRRFLPDAARWLASVLGGTHDRSRHHKIRETLDWIEQNCVRPITVADISQVSLMSERTLLRHFRAAVGVTPSEYLLNVRFELACRLLISTTLPVDKVARRCGFASGMALAKQFRKQLSVSASEYRAAARDRHGS